MGKLINMLDLPADPTAWPSWEEANRAFQREYLIQVLTTANGNQYLAAHLLGIHRNTLGWLCERLGVEAALLRMTQKEKKMLRRAADRQRVLTMQISERSPNATP
jgi:hypothetical protein